MTPVALTVRMVFCAQATDDPPLRSLPRPGTKNPNPPLEFRRPKGLGGAVGRFDRIVRHGVARLVDPKFLRLDEEFCQRRLEIPAADFQAARVSHFDQQ